MSTHNICFCAEIRKILCGYPLSSVAVILLEDSEGPNQIVRLCRQIWVFADRICLKTHFRVTNVGMGQRCENREEKRTLYIQLGDKKPLNNINDLLCFCCLICLCCKYLTASSNKVRY